VKEIRRNGIDAITFTTEKDKRYVTCVIFGTAEAIKTSELETFKLSCPANEYLFCSPDIYGNDSLYLSILDVDSFRRVQQIMLRGMIYADEKQISCPFCGNMTEKSDDGYVCRACHADVAKMVCPNTKREYFISSILKGTAGYEQDKRRADRRKFLHDRYDESQLHYRNITPIDEHGEHICPCCGKQHARSIM
jgi:hypothetical protein